MMRVTNILFAIVLIFVSTGCYAEMRGTVIDEETGKPIEGAVVLVQWTKTKGLPGLAYHKADKIIEDETDKEGKFSIQGTYNSLTNSPIILFYKSGYVVWRNDFIFPGLQKNDDFQYQDNLLIKMKRFKKEYSREKHHSFMGLGIIGDNFEITPKYSNAKNDELKKALVEVKKAKGK